MTTAARIDLASPEARDPVIASLRRDAWHKVTNDDGSSFLIRLATSEAGVLICTGLVLGAEPSPQGLSARSLRGIPLAAAMTSFVEWQQRAPGFDPGDALGGTSVRPARPGPKGYSDEFWERLQTDYRRCAADHPEAPVKWLSAERNTPEVTVRRWLKQAQSHGFLAERSAKPGAPRRSTTTDKDRTDDDGK